jgi:hypothetical protein
MNSSYFCFDGPTILIQVATCFVSITERTVCGLNAQGLPIDDAQGTCFASAANGICAKVNYSLVRVTLLE